jgi:hypothetical protein
MANAERIGWSWSDGAKKRGNAADQVALSIPNA